MSDAKQNVRTTRFGKRQVLFDAGLVAEPDEALFSPPAGDSIDTAGSGIGRAQVVMYRRDGLELVSRHYLRGGMLAWLGDVYFGVKAENSRSFREWCMLSVMRSQGLPVPVPVAASVISSGMFYRADLVTQRITDAVTLADACAAAHVDVVLWRLIGAVIRQFHDRNVCHADLNARNILIDARGGVHLLDFDKGRFRQVGSSWRHNNLSRLKRSLDKFRLKDAAFNFSVDDWKALLQGYNG